MNITETILFVTIGAALLVVGFVFYNFISDTFPARPKYKAATSHLRGRSTIEHALYGPLTLEGGELLSENHARLQGRDIDGKIHMWTGYYDEFEPGNIWQCMGITGGNPQFRYIQSKRRILAGLDAREKQDKLTAMTVEFKRQAQEAETNQKVTEAGMHVQVERTIDQMGALQRSGQPTVRNNR